MLIVLQDIFGSLISYNIPRFHCYFYIFIVDFIESSLYTTKFYFYMDKKIIWVYTIIVFTKKQKKEEIILCAMFCGKKKNFCLIRQKH